MTILNTSIKSGTTPTHPPSLGSTITGNLSSYVIQSVIGNTTTDVDILRREYRDNDSGLFTSLRERQLGFNVDTIDNELTLIYKDSTGVRFDITNKGIDQVESDITLSGLGTTSSPLGIDLTVSNVWNADITANNLITKDNLTIEGLDNSTINENRILVHNSGDNIVRYRTNTEIASDIGLTSHIGNTSNPHDTSWQNLDGDQSQILLSGFNNDLSLSDFPNDVGFLTSESDTLNSVTDRGNSTSNSIIVGRITSGNFEAGTYDQDSAWAVFGHKDLVNTGLATDYPFLSNGNGRAIITGRSAQNLELRAYRTDNQALISHIMNYNATYQHDFTGVTRFQQPVVMVGSLTMFDDVVPNANGSASLGTSSLNFSSVHSLTINAVSGVFTSGVTTAGLVATGNTNLGNDQNDKHTFYGDITATDGNLLTHHEFKASKFSYVSSGAFYSGGSRSEPYIANTWKTIVKSDYLEPSMIIKVFTIGSTSVADDISTETHVTTTSASTIGIGREIDIVTNNQYSVEFQVSAGALQVRSTGSLDVFFASAMIVAGYSLIIP